MQKQKSLVDKIQNLANGNIISLIFCAKIPL